MFWLKIIPVHFLQGFFFFLFMPFFVPAQTGNIIQGKVTNEAGQGIPNCSVYFNGTSKGDITNASGDFTLRNLPQGNYDLVISAIGYETAVMEVSSSAYPKNILVKLKNKSTELSEVTVEPVLKNGWERWGHTFLSNFIGSTPNAAQCKIKNYKVLKFWYSEKYNRLSVRADEPLIIENKALGYTIKYKLEKFSSDFSTGMLIYLGYPFYEEMISKRSRQKKEWEQNRRTAFEGSVMHFMRSLYGGKLNETGFQVIVTVKTPNVEKLRIKQIRFSDSTIADSGSSQALIRRRDSLGYFQRILKQPDYFTSYKRIMEMDSLLRTTETASKLFFFRDTLHIIFQAAKTSPLDQSEIFLATPEGIRIDENGSYFPPQEMVTSGRWGRYEKIANSLPLDYHPAN